MYLFFANTILSIIMLTKNLSPAANNLLLLLLFTDLVDFTAIVPLILGSFVLNDKNKSAWAELREANSGIAQAMYIIFMIQFVIGTVGCGLAVLSIIIGIIMVILDASRNQGQSSAFQANSHASYSTGKTQYQQPPPAFL